MIVGTAVLITSEMSRAATTVIINIYDPEDTQKITDIAMTDDGNNSWSYIYQSDDADTSGEYKTIIIATASNGKISKSKAFFKLNDQDEEVG